MVRFSRYAPPVEFKPGSARAAKLTQSPQRGQALFLIQDKPATIFTIAKTGAMLFVGQICSRETTALAVEPSCGSDSKSRATLRSSTSLGKTLQACRETQGEFQGHTITPLGVTGAFCVLVSVLGVFSEVGSWATSGRAYWLAGRKKRAAGRGAGEEVGAEAVACSSMRFRRGTSNISAAMARSQASLTRASP